MNRNTQMRRSAKLTVHVTPALASWLQLQAVRQKRSVSQLMSMILESHRGEGEGKKAK